MSLRINTNIAAISGRRNLEINQRQVEKSLRRLASGSRITQAGDDAAGFAIAEALKGQISSTRQAGENSNNAVSLIQTAEGGLNEQNNILVRIRELAVHAASDTVGEQEREFLDKEVQQLVDEFDRLAKSTRFGTKTLLNGDGQEFSFQVGAFRGPENIIKFTLDADTRAEAAGIESVTVTEQDDALDALEVIDSAVLKVGGVRASFGAIQSRFHHVIDNLSVQEENLEQAKSQIADVDVAEETALLASSQVRQEMAISVLAQANQEPKRMLRLLA